MVQTPQADTSAQDSDDSWVRREELEVPLRPFGKYFNVERDKLLVLLEELIGGYKNLRLQNQGHRLHRSWIELGREEKDSKKAELIFKEDPDSAERAIGLPSLCLRQTNRSKKNRRRVSKSEWLPSKAPMAKRRKSCDTKLSPSAASLFQVNEASNRENEPRSISLGYTLVNADDKATINLFYHYCFATIGALCMKRILKAWIKAIHDKKQVTHPYKGRDATRPDYWPALTDNPNSNCRHIEPDHLQNKERLILAVWFLHLVDVSHLRRSTQQIAGSLEENHREIAMHLLNSLYDVRELEQGHEDRDRDGHYQIFLNVSLQKMREKEEKRPVYRFPTEDERRACEIFIAQAEAPLVSLSYKFEKMMNKKFARDSKKISAQRRYAQRDRKHQQKPVTVSSINPDIAVPEPAPPFTNEPPYLCGMNSLRGGVSHSLDPLNLIFRESPDELAMPSTIETGQAGMVAFKYEEDDTANFSNRATTDTNFPLHSHVSRPELQSHNADQDIYGQIGSTAWSSTHLPIRNRTVPDSLLLCTPNGYSQTPESSMDFFDVNFNHSDHLSELAGEELRWQSQMRDDAAVGAIWPLSISTDFSA